MSRQHQPKTSAHKAKPQFAAPPVIQPKATKKRKPELPEWKPGGSGAVSPLQRLIDSKVAQAKLTIGQPNDQYEQQADAVAKDVVQRINSPVSDAPQETQENNLQMKSLLQRKESQEPPENKTGLPNRLKAGVETLSGISIDDVKVHYNSPEPAKLQAAAYTEGTDIHVAPKQEKHLAHEAWHVVQQKQARVKPSVQLKGIKANVDSKLEQEADVMGAKAARLSNVVSRLPERNQVELSREQLGQASAIQAQPVKQFKNGGSSSSGTESGTSEKPTYDVDRDNQQFPSSNSKLTDKVLENPKYAKIPKDSKIPAVTVKCFNLEPVRVEEVSTWFDLGTEISRKEVPTVLYRPKSEKVVYHTTKKEDVESIVSNGLDPSYGGKKGAVGTVGEANARDYVYLGHDIVVAKQVAQNFYGDDDGIMTILKVTITPDILFVRDPDMTSAVRTTAKLTNIEPFANTYSFEGAGPLRNRIEGGRHFEWDPNEQTDALTLRKLEQKQKKKDKKR
ncbi:MAG: DUF4157 domain-containing protein [Roseofilum sp. SBFL]|nr:MULTISPECIES: DUF4157 domain-containing protein [unclassified Roseofilum]MBP0015419.1 DUF4157 domain-containing protein [Roseofilum sp. SID3]MBP0024970.1 DUF4157 domain-containing protein [Roseofilum sp. SID2]MBP0034626.1 DUF4157 domain-containing protein [Roseofilum sp. Belize BBD 4]MBP0043544.1 DUF4157 domain-containing protein [Roseofilum sp. SBFL]